MSQIYQKVIRGRGSLREIMQMTEKFGITRPLIIGSRLLTDKLLKKAPALLKAPVFNDYHPNPDLQDAIPAVILYHTQQCDGIISIGGGSAIDTAKAVKALLYSESLENTLKGRFLKDMSAPHLAIPGTAGTGAEATQNAVVYDENRKVSLSHPALRPEGVILDAELLESLPIYHKKAAALDALCQGIESFWCLNATEDSKVHAFLAILGILDNIRDYMANDPHAAEEMLDASFQSGKAIQITHTTAAHAMSYQLTKILGYAHGHACMLTLPVLWEMAAEHEEMKPVLQDLAKKMRLSEQQLVPRLLRGILYDLELDVPAITDSEIVDRLVASVDPERLGNHPIHMSTSDIENAYRKAFTPLCAAEKQTCLDIWNYYNS